MDDALQNNYLVLLASLVFIIYIYQQLIVKRRRIEDNKLPPSPPSLPIIGHFHLLKWPIHKTINSLSDKYGPIFFLRLGSSPVLVASARSTIEECLADKGTIFANRPFMPSRRIPMYDFTTISAPYGSRWRTLRRLFALEILSSKSIQMSRDIRNEEVRFMIKHIFRGVVGKVVDAKSLFYMFDFNIMMRIVTGNRCFEGEEIMGIDNIIAKDKLDYYKHIFGPSTDMALGDFFPFLRWLTYFGVEKKMVKAHKEKDAFLQSILDAHRNIKSPNHGDHIIPTLLDVLLKLQESESEFYTDVVIKGVMQTMLIAGTHTTVLSMEWIISRLTSHPEVLKKARVEIDDVVGQSRLLNDADLAKLPYLHGIINETLRLNSAVAVTRWRESTKECTVAGYSIPQGTQLWVSFWAMHMDPQVWPEPESFKPERFLRGDDEEKGRSKILAFGSGRRQCPGEGLAMRVMAMSLGTLIQCFDWEKVEEESHGTAKKKFDSQDKSLKIIFRPREELTKLLSRL